MKRIALFVAVIALGTAALAAAHDGEHGAVQVPWQQATEWPDRIVATMDGDPATSVSISWRTAGSVQATKAEIAKALPDARFDKAAMAVTAQTQRLGLAHFAHAGVTLPIEHNRDLPATSHHSVRFDGLQPDTLYAYRVQGGEGRWSEWLQTRTAPRSGPLRFIYLGDAQNGLASQWPRVIRAAFQSAPDARFILHAGDLVNRGSRDLEWAHWFRAGGFIHGMIRTGPGDQSAAHRQRHRQRHQRRGLRTHARRQHRVRPAAPAWPQRQYGPERGAHRHQYPGHRSRLQLVPDRRKPPPHLGRRARVQHDGVFGRWCLQHRGHQGPDAGS